MGSPSIDLNDAAMLVTLSRCASLSEAAEIMQQTKSTLSRRLARLEQQLGSPLAVRNNRNLRLTEAGERFVAQCRPLLADLDWVCRCFIEDSATPRGKLRVSTPISIGNYLLKNHLTEFLHEHPHIDLELVLCNENRSIVAEGFDLVLRFGPLHDSSLQAVVLWPLPTCVVASPDLIATAPVFHPLELKSRPCIIAKPLPDRLWPFRDRNDDVLPVRVRGRLVVNELQAAVQAAVAGFGYAYLPRFGVSGPLEEGRLVEVLTDWLPEPPRLTALFPQQDRRTRALDYLITFLKSVVPPA